MVELARGESDLGERGAVAIRNEGNGRPRYGSGHGS